MNNRRLESRNRERRFKEIALTILITVGAIVCFVLYLAMFGE